MAARSDREKNVIRDLIMISNGSSRIIKSVEFLRL